MTKHCRDRSAESVRPDRVSVMLQSGTDSSRNASVAPWNVAVPEKLPLHRFAAGPLRPPSTRVSPSGRAVSLTVVVPPSPWPAYLATEPPRGEATGRAGCVGAGWA